MLDVRAHSRNPRRAQSGAQQRPRPLDAAREVIVACCLEIAPSGVLAVAREPCGALECDRGRDVCPRRNRAFDRRLLERLGDGLVRAESRIGEMPGALDAGRDGSERGVHGPTLERRRPVVAGRAQERVPPRETIVSERDERCPLGGLERLRIEPEHGERVEHRRQSLGVATRGDEQRSLGLGRQRRQPHLEGATDARSDGQRIRERRLRRRAGPRLSSAGSSSSASGLPAVASTRLRATAGATRFAGVAASSSPAARAIEPVDAKLGDSRPVEDVRLVVAHRDEHGHAVGVEPADGKEQGLRRAASSQCASSTTTSSGRVLSGAPRSDEARPSQPRRRLRGRAARGPAHS